MTPDLAVLGLFLLAGLITVVGLGFVFARSSSAAAWVLVTVFAVTEGIVPPLELQVTLGSLTVYGMDVVAMPMLVIGVARLLSHPHPRWISVSLAALCALFAIHLLSGAAAFGLQAAVTSARPWLYLLGPLMYASQARISWRRESFRPLIVGAVAMAGFALFHFAQYGVHSANTYIDIRGEFLDARPVASDGSLLIIQCALIAVSARFVRSLPWWVAVASMGIAVVLLQHRTIWVVAALTGVVAYVRWARVSIFSNERAALAATSALLFVGPVAVALTVSSNAFAESVGSATGASSTLAWRTDSWETLISSHHAPEEVLVGVPAGTSLERRIGDTVATQSPHSVYVDAFLSFGTLGPLILVGLWILVIRRRRHVASALGVSSVVVALLIVSQALYGITNMLAPVEGLLLGMMLHAAYLTSRPDRSQRASSDRAGITAAAVR